MDLSNLINNKQTLKELTALLKGNHLSHSIVLLSSNKELLNSVAKYIAAWAVCTASSNKPCGICNGCVKASTNNHSDIYYAQKDGKKSLITIDEVKNIIKDSYIIPNEANAKVYIIEDGNKMLEPAQNAMLKSLEEPPQNLFYIITGDSKEGLLNTILSRCTVFNLDANNTDINLDSESDLQAKQISHNICLAIGRKNEYELLLQMSELTSRDIALQVLLQLEASVRNTLFIKSGVQIDNTSPAEAALTALTSGKLMKITDIIFESKNALDRNINIKLFGNWLCQSIKHCI